MDLFAASEERGEATILVTFDQKKFQRNLGTNIVWMRLQNILNNQNLTSTLSDAELQIALTDIDCKMFCE